MIKSKKIAEKRLKLVKTHGLLAKNLIIVILYNYCFKKKKRILHRFISLYPLENDL